MIKPNINKEGIIVDLEIILIDDNLKSDYIKENYEIKLKKPKIIGLINRIPFYNCKIININQIPILKIESILDITQSLEIEESLKE